MQATKASKGNAGRILHARDRLVQCSLPMDRKPTASLASQVSGATSVESFTRFGTKRQPLRPAFTCSACWF